MVRITTDDGITLVAEARGDASLPPVVLVHAFPTNHAAWAPQVAALEGRARTIAYDVRGFGRSDAPEDPAAYGQDRSVADLLAVLDHFGIGRAVLCGLSMGGNIVLNFAFAHPERVSRLVISGTGSGTGNHADFAAMVEGWARIAETEGIEAFAETVMRAPIFAEYADRGPKERAHMRALATAGTARGIAHTCRRVLMARPTMDTLVPKLARMTCPTTVVVGARDEAVMVASRLMAETIPGARWIEVPDTGHFNSLERPEVLNRLLLDLVEGL